jgi:regulator of cell morphogenesis and NO signaling
MYQTANLYLSPDMKMAEVVLNNPYLMLLLEHFGISAPLQEKTIREICDEHKLHPEVFLTFAHLYNGVDYKPAERFTYREVRSIINYLSNSHSYYLAEIYPNILKLIQEMFKDKSQPEQAMVEKFFNNYFNEVREHLDYENETVFPYITKLYQKIAERGNVTLPDTYSVADYQEHHDDIEEKLTDLTNLLVKYLPNNDEPQVRRKLLFTLFELDYDLTIHSKIEDQILIPLVQQMENYLSRKTT